MTSMVRRNRAGFDPIPEVDIRLEAWHSDAACRGVDGDWITPVYGNTRDKHKVKALELAMCEICPVAQPCLEFALETREAAGIWGGLFPDERRNLARRTMVR